MRNILLSFALIALLAVSVQASVPKDTFHSALIARTGTTDIPFTWLADYGVLSLGDDLYATLHRTYHAGYMRFLSKDPIGLDGGLNLYAYGDLNPLFYLDYLGLCSQNFESNGKIKQPASSQSYGFVADLQRQQFQAQEDYKRQSDPYYDLQPGYATPVSVLDDPITYVAFGLARAVIPASTTFKAAVESTTWPANRGFTSIPEKAVIQPGSIVDRYGSSSGKFVAPQGTSFGARSLPSEFSSKPLNAYEITKPISVDIGVSSPWFKQTGLGVQMELPQSVNQLIESGHMRPY